MADKINLNRNPYFDDFNEDKKFLRVLLRPGYSVQARELNQLQSILQNQIERFGTHMFKDGAMIVPGQVGYDSNHNYIQIENANSLTEIVSSVWFQDAVIESPTTGVKATVREYVGEENGDPITVYVKYISAGEDVMGKSVTTFLPGETLKIINHPDPFYINKEVDVISNSGAVGTGTAAYINEGVYFVNGFFVKVSSQKIFLDKYSSENISYRVGLLAEHSIVTEKDDTSLYSNASGEPNYSAPGAHRYKIELKLVKSEIQPEDDPRGVSNEPDFIQLLVLKDDIVYFQVRYTDYNIIEETFARRTYDESGDYTVRPFPVQLRPYLDDGSNNGIYRRSLTLTNLVDLSLNPVEINVGDRLYESNTNAIGIVTLFNRKTNRVFYILDDENNKFFDFDNIEIQRFDDPNDPTPGWNTYATSTIDTAFGNDFDEKIGISVSPGKAYVRGYEIEKLASENLSLERSLSFQTSNDVQIDVPHGNAVYVKNLSAGLPKIHKFQLVDLGYLDETSTFQKTGIARIKAIQYDSGDLTVASNTTETNNFGKCFLHLFDISMLPGNTFENVERIESSDFSCDIITDLYKLSGQITGDHISSDDPTQTYNLSGFGADCNFEVDLKVGNILYVRPADPNNRIKIKILTILNRYQATYTILSHTASPLPTIDKQDYFVQYASLMAPNNNILVYRLPHTNIKKLSKVDFVDPDDIDIKFSTFRTILDIETEAVPNPDHYFILSPNDGAYLSVSLSDYILYNRDTDEYVNPTSIVPITILGPGEVTEAEIHVGANPGSYDVIFITYKKGVGNKFRIKNKKLNEEYEIVDSGLLEQDIITLPHVDVFRIKNIFMAKTIAAPYDDTDQVDVTKRYVLDTGQRDNYYDYGRLIRKKNSPLPTGSLKIVYDYFEHEPKNASEIEVYYCANSYHDGYDEIPTFTSANGTQYELRDSLDFRPDVFEMDELSSSIELQVPFWYFICDYEYYLNRRDALILSQDGNFEIVQGVPAIEPKSPTLPENSMLLHKFFVPAYTADPTDVEVEKVENKRYTMRDIGKLETRIKSLEYYTSLALLELETAKFEAIDPKTGLNRFRLGFIVDSFQVPLNSQESVGDIASSDCRCSIDTETTTCRPTFDSRSIVFQLVEPTLPNVTKAGDIITLPYEEKEYIRQEYATTTENVNPFDIVVFRGAVQLDPSTDTWKEEKYIDAERIEIEGNFKALDELTRGQGTIWNDWETNWSGFTNESDPERVPGVIQLGWVLNSGEEIYFSELGYDNAGKRLPIDKVPAAQRKRIEENRKKVRQSHPKKKILERRWTTTKSGTMTTVKTGVQMGVREVIDEQNIGEKVISVDFIPFMRPRLIKFTGTRLLPNAQFYAFFDEKPVSSHCVGEQSDLTTHPVTGIQSVTTPTPLKTDGKGEIQGYFDLPNNEELKFSTGDKIFKLTTSIDNQPDQNESFGEARYQATGLLETKQNTILAVRNAEIIRTPVSTTTVIDVEQPSSFSTVTQTDWIDPIAQTFRATTEDGTGLCITSVDIFFKNKPQFTDTPIELQIRETIADERPSPNRILPFARVLKYASEVNVSDDASAFTRFTFDTPVYLMENHVYAICLISASNEYRVYIADKKAPDPTGEATNVIITPVEHVGEIYSTEPFQQFGGVFFKSSNSGTWTDDQYVDMKFTLWKADFDISFPGVVEFEDNLDPIEFWEELPPNPLKIKSLSQYMRVWHPSHGYKSGDLVSLVKTNDVPLVFYDTSIPGGQYQNIGSNDLVELIIVRAEIDYYIVQTPNNNLVWSYLDNNEYSGFVGGTQIVATRNKKFDLMRMILSELNFGAWTSTRHFLHSTEFYDVVNKERKLVGEIIPSENYIFDESQIIYNDVNKNPLNSSVKVVSYLYSNNKNLSPMIDTKRFGAVLINNRVDYPEEDINHESDKILIHSSVVGDNGELSYYAAGYIEITGFTADVAGNVAARKLYNLLGIGKYLELPVNQGITDRLILKKNYIGENLYDGIRIYVNGNISNSASPIDTFQIQLYDYFVDEIAPLGGSAAAKYVTKRMALANSATVLSIYFAGENNLNSEFKVYYKVLREDDNRDFDEIEYTLVEPKNIANPSMAQGLVAEYECEVDFKDLGEPPFIAAICKIVMLGTDSANPPKIRDFRMIAWEY